jgi:hypothetical protein
VTTINIPADWDVDYIIRQARLTHGFGVGPAEDGVITINFYGGDYEAALRAVEAYPTAYVAECLPKKLRAISDERDRRIRNFMFGPFTIDLEGDAKRDLADAALGLMRNERVAGIDWSLGDGEFIQIPRDTLLQMADAAFVHVQSTFSGHRRLAERAKAATTVDELKAVNELNDANWMP